MTIGSGPNNYPISDKELLAVVEAFKQWRVYLEGAETPVRVYTDHKNLEYFSTARTTSRGMPGGRPPSLRTSTPSSGARVQPTASPTLCPGAWTTFPLPSPPSPSFPPQVPLPCFTPPTWLAQLCS